MRIATAALIVTAALFVASPVFAQATGTSSSRQRPPSKPPAPPLPKPVMNVRVFGALEIEGMAASDTFKAVTGSSTMFGYGGGGEIVNLWKTLFVRGDYTTSSASGERVFAIGDDVISTGIPLKVRLGTFEVAGGWRFRLRKLPKYTPYAGGALLFVSYSEKSDFETETVKDSFPGYSILGGLDIRLQSRWFATVEAQYRFVPDAIGTGGVSLVYGEKDLGGFVARVMVGYNLKK